MPLNKVQKIDKIYEEAVQKLDELILEQKKIVKKYRKIAEEEKIKNLKENLAQ